MNADRLLKLVIVAFGICFVAGIAAGAAGSSAMLVVGQVVALVVALILAITPILIWREIERMRADAGAHAAKLEQMLKTQVSQSVAIHSPSTQQAPTGSARPAVGTRDRRVIEIGAP